MTITQISSSEISSSFTMACLVFMLLLLAMAGHSSAATTTTWCVCKDMDANILQKTLDYACGAGAECNPTHENQACYNPNTVVAHCSYAVNSYYQKHGQQPTACDFAGTASISTTNPSTQQGCAYPTTTATSSSTNTPQLTPPTTSTGGTTTMPNGSPVVTTPSGGGILAGGTNSGILGPPGINNDISDGGGVLIGLASTLTILLISFSIIITFSAALVL